jgi:SAM-dependent MidA family methyltransferase
MLADLPQPDASAVEHSRKLAAHIRATIAAADGWISFADYMDMALYAPGLGYYSAGARKLGAAGDFVTAPEISGLFSRCLAGQCAEVLASVQGNCVLELGAGSGIMAADMLLELERLGQLPTEYLILEPSADLRERQAETLALRAAHLAERVRWLDGMPEAPVRGVIVANEVADALPVERFVIGTDGVLELGVGCAGDDFVAVPKPAAAALNTLVQAVQADIGRDLACDYSSELCVRLPAWVQAVSGWLEQGAVLLLDYGYSRREYYLPDRSSGTLRCFYRHRAHEDPFLWPGLQDITAWVDFSALANAAQTAGLNVAGYTTQAQFLLAAGLEERLAAVAGSDPQAQAELAHGLRQLILPGEMGEAVKVIALTTAGVDAPSAMGGRDMRAVL